MTVQFVYFFDQTLFMRLTAAFYNHETAIKVLAEYQNKAMGIAGIPPILAIALGASIIPVISSAYALKNMQEVQRQSSLVMRIVCFTGVPVALLLTVASYSVTGLLFTSPSGSDTVALLTAGAIFQITMMISNSIFYGLNKPKHAHEPYVYRDWPKGRVPVLHLRLCLAYTDLSLDHRFASSLLRC